MHKREIYTSKDGSKTLYWPAYDEHYHSVHGAFTESMHVFINAGLQEVAKSKSELSIFEMGFGTGLNTLLTYSVAQREHLSIHYTSIEAFPVELELQNQLDFTVQLHLSEAEIKNVQQATWNEEVKLDHNFILHKVNDKLEAFQPSRKFDLIYYDAFAPSAQPELWTLSIFEKLYGMLNKNGILTTYCAKGQVKRDLKAAGFAIEPLPGPPGKREMTRARKV